MKPTTRRLNCAAAALALALGAASVANAEDQSTRAAKTAETHAQTSSGKPADNVAAVLVLLPVVQANDAKLGNGCWVKFYDGTDYKGASLTLVGPVDMPKMDVPAPAWRDWDSAIVGPKATVTTYDNEAYNDRTAVLNAGQHFKDLHDKKLGWFDEVKSVRMSCA